jgi:hypothetical protein
LASSDIGVKLAHIFCKKQVNFCDEDVTFLRHNEWLILFQKKIKPNTTILLFLDTVILSKVTVGEMLRHVNLGDWITAYLWRFDGENFEIKSI